MTFRPAKYFAFAALLFVPLEVHAQALDLTPYPARFLSDPNYLPLAGQIYGSSSYTHGWTSGTSENALGLESSNFQVNTNTLDQMLAYGITDDLSVNASIQYAPQSYREVDYANGSSASFDSSGFSDPTFGATWRLLDQGSYPVNFDLLGSYTPDVIDAHTATAFEDATVARGGQSGAVGGAVGYETRSFGIRGAFNANFFGKSDIFNLANGATTQTQGFTDYKLSLETQTRLTDLFSVNAGIAHTFAANQSAVNLANGVPHSTEPGDDTALQLALNYNFVPDAFVISATYAHEFYGNGHTLYVDPALDTTTRDKSGNLLGVKLTYATP